MGDADQLLRELHDPWGELSWSASGELLRLGEKRAVDPWLAMLDECLARPAEVTAEDRHYWGAIDGLGTFREPRAYDRLVRLVGEAGGITRQHAAAALGRFGDRRAIPILLEALTQAGSNRRLHHAIALALADLHAAEAVPTLLAEFADADLLNIAYRAAEAAGTLGEPARAPLLAALGDADPQVRACAVLGLAALGGAPVVEPLLGVLADPDHAVRWQAARVLGELGDQRAVSSLQAMQMDGDEEVRKVVLSALRKLGDRAGPRPPRPSPSRHVLTVDADYGQLWIGDSAFEAHAESTEFWNTEAFERRLAADAPGLLGIGTARQFGDITVVVELVAGSPTLDLGAWDRVVEASLALPSGRLLLAGPLDFHGGAAEPKSDAEEAPYVDLPPGTYRLRISYGGQDTLDEDHYQVALWPHESYLPPSVLKPVLASAQSGRAPDASGDQAPDLVALVRAADLGALDAALRRHRYAQPAFQAALSVAVEYALATHNPVTVGRLIQAGADFTAWSRPHPHAARRFVQLVNEFNAIAARHWPQPPQQL